MSGNWGEVWNSFDRRKGPKAANDAAAEADEKDMFEQAGIAAE